MLKIIIPQGDFNLLSIRQGTIRSHHREVAGQALAGVSSYKHETYYITSSIQPSIPMRYLSIAVGQIQRVSDHEYRFGKDWYWMPLSEFNFQDGLYPIVPDWPSPRTTVSIDINQMVHNAIMTQLNA